MSKYFVKCVTEKCAGGWQVRVVRTSLIDVRPGYLLAGVFRDPSTLGLQPYYKSRKEAREALRAYASVRSFRVIGGLH